MGALAGGRRMTNLRLTIGAANGYDKSNACPETLTRPCLATARRVSSILRVRGVLLPRIVLCIHVNDILGAYTMNLDDGFFASPDEVIGLGWHDFEAAGLRSRRDGSRGKFR
jgi:hypothetical protein